MAAGFLVAIVFYMVIGIPIGAIILRAGVSLANKILGPPDESFQSTPYESLDMESTVADPENPYSAPTVTSVATERVRTTIPEPSFGTAYVIVLAQVIVGFIVGLIIGFTMAATIGPEVGLMGPIFSVMVTLVTNTGILSGMLPTTFRRGLLVSIMQIVVTLLIVAVVVALYVGVSAMAG